MTRTNPISLTANPDGTHTLSLFDRDIGWMAPVRVSPRPQTIVAGASLRGGAVRSCGCLRNDTPRRARTKNKKALGNALDWFGEDIL